MSLILIELSDGEYAGFRQIEFELSSYDRERINYGELIVVEIPSGKVTDKWGEHEPGAGKSEDFGPTPDKLIDECQAAIDVGECPTCGQLLSGGSCVRCGWRPQ